MEVSLYSHGKINGIGHQLAVSSPVRRVKLFHDDNSRLRYLSREEYDRQIKAPRALTERA